jgi:hypothetical protein
MPPSQLLHFLVANVLVATRSYKVQPAAPVCLGAVVPSATGHRATPCSGPLTPADLIEQPSLLPGPLPPAVLLQLHWPGCAHAASWFSLMLAVNKCAVSSPVCYDHHASDGLYLILCLSLQRASIQHGHPNTALMSEGTRTHHLTCASALCLRPP